MSPWYVGGKLEYLYEWVGEIKGIEGGGLSINGVNYKWNTGGGTNVSKCRYKYKWVYKYKWKYKYKCKYKYK